MTLVQILFAEYLDGACTLFYKFQLRAFNEQEDCSFPDIKNGLWWGGAGFSFPGEIDA